MIPGPADFSLTVCFGGTPFGFVAFRHDVYLVSGPEGFWLPWPSWVFGIAVLALAAFEWWLFKLSVRAAARVWARRRTANP